MKAAVRLPAPPGAQVSLSFPRLPLTPRDLRCFLLFPSGEGLFFSILLTSKGCAVRQPAFEFSSLTHLLGKPGQAF